jgi:dTDP-glucose 4,6-dehydratase
MTIFVTGGAGFIGSNFVYEWLADSDEVVINLDLLTYAGNRWNLNGLRDQKSHIFVQGSIGDVELVSSLLKEHRPRAVINFAAESHVDRSIAGPAQFMTTNIMDLFHMLECVRAYTGTLSGEERDGFRFLQVSTDEVYGSLGKDDPAFTETRRFEPNSPYSASKAAGDHLVRAWHHTYGVNVLTTNCSNNYGPFQFPEKLIPLMIVNALSGKELPVYGDGKQVRDWLYVGDHCSAIKRVLDAGVPGETYNIGGNCEKENIEVVRTLCQLLDEMQPREDGRSFAEQIAYVKDRPGHDRRYAVDTSRIEAEMGWQPQESFASGLRKTLDWYLANGDWLDNVRSGAYREWIDAQYGAEK